MLSCWNYIASCLMAGITDWKARIGSEKGQTMVEYGLIIALITVGLMVVLTAVHGGLYNIFNSISTELNSASQAAGAAQ